MLNLNGFNFGSNKSFVLRPIRTDINESQYRAIYYDFGEATPITIDNVTEYKATLSQINEIYEFFNYIQNLLKDGSLKIYAEYRNNENNETGYYTKSIDELYFYDLSNLTPDENNLYYPNNVGNIQFLTVDIVDTRICVYYEFNIG